MGEYNSQKFAKLWSRLSILLLRACIKQGIYLSKTLIFFHCRKHAESTVLVMELLGESMSMLRMSPDASRGISVTKCVSVGLEVSLKLLYPL